MIIVNKPEPNPLPLTTIKDKLKSNDKPCRKIHVHATIHPISFYISFFPELRRKMEMHERRQQELKRKADMFDELMAKRPHVQLDSSDDEAETEWGATTTTATTGAVSLLSDSAVVTTDEVLNNSSSVLGTVSTRRASLRSSSGTVLIDASSDANNVAALMKGVDATATTVNGDRSQSSTPTSTTPTPVVQKTGGRSGRKQFVPVKKTLLATAVDDDDDDEENEEEGMEGIEESGSPLNIGGNGGRQIGAVVNGGDHHLADSCDDNDDDNDSVALEIDDGGLDGDQDMATTDADAATENADDATDNGDNDKEVAMATENDKNGGDSGDKNDGDDNDGGNIDFEELDRSISGTAAAIYESDVGDGGETNTEGEEEDVNGGGEGDNGEEGEGDGEKSGGEEEGEKEENELKSSLRSTRSAEKKGGLKMVINRRKPVKS